MDTENLTAMKLFLDESDEAAVSLRYSVPPARRASPFWCERRPVSGTSQEPTQACLTLYLCFVLLMLTSTNVDPGSS